LFIENKNVKRFSGYIHGALLVRTHVSSPKRQTGDQKNSPTVTRRWYNNRHCCYIRVVVWSSSQTAHCYVTLSSVSL